MDLMLIRRSTAQASLIVEIFRRSFVRLLHGARPESLPPKGLRAAGSAAQSLGARLGGAIRPGQEGAVCPSGDGHGWAAWSAMCTAGTQWSAELAGLSRSMAAAGEEIVAAVDAYRGADHGPAARFGW